MALGKLLQFVTAELEGLKARIRNGHMPPPFNTGVHIWETQSTIVNGSMARTRIRSRTSIPDNTSTEQQPMLPKDVYERLETLPTEFSINFVLTAL